MTDTDLALKLFVVLSRASTAVAAHAEADVRRHGLSLAEFAALEALYHRGDLLVGELQKKVLKSSGGMTYVIDRLEEKDLAERKPCPGDRRAVYAGITPAGRGLMDRIFPIHASALKASMEALTREQKRAAVDLLRELGKGAAAAPLPESEQG